MHTGRKQARRPHLFIAIFECLYKADICAKFEKNVDGTLFLSELC